MRGRARESGGLGPMRHRLGITVAAALVAATGIVANPAPATAAWVASLNVKFDAFDIVGDGAGRVTSDDGGIDCTQSPGGVASGDCSQSYTLANFASSYDVVLTLNPATGSYACKSGITDCSADGSTRELPVQLTMG